MLNYINSVLCFTKLLKTHESIGRLLHWHPVQKTVLQRWHYEYYSFLSQAHIHKSYLVRKTVIHTLDHTTREIVLDNDERLPVSSRYWAHITGWLAGKQNNREEEKQ